MVRYVLCEQNVSVDLSNLMMPITVVPIIFVKNQPGVIVFLSCRKKIERPNVVWVELVRIISSACARLFRQGMRNVPLVRSVPQARTVCLVKLMLMMKALRSSVLFPEAFVPQPSFVFVVLKRLKTMSVKKISYVRNGRIV